MVGKLKTYDKERISINIARLKKGGDKFEIDIDPDKAIEFKQGRLAEIREVLKAEKIFSDIKKGLLASDNEMKSLFGTSDVLEVARKIIKEGEIQISAEHRQKLRDEKKKRIIALISRNGIDPRTSLPHPPARIESALDQIKVKIDEFKSADEQLQDIVKALMPILPIRFEVREIEIRVPVTSVGKANSTIRHFSKVLKEEWLPDGSLKVLIELPAGMQEDFFDRLNSITHGGVESRIIKTK